LGGIVRRAALAFVNLTAANERLTTRLFISQSDADRRGVRELRQHKKLAPKLPYDIS
jgi:hypothetical protein